jgi:hypothetical protein
MYCICCTGGGACKTRGDPRPEGSVLALAGDCVLDFSGLTPVLSCLYYHFGSTIKKNFIYMAGLRSSFHNTELKSNLTGQLKVYTKVDGEKRLHDFVDGNLQKQLRKFFFFLEKHVYIPFFQGWIGV